MVGRVERLAAVTLLALAALVAPVAIPIRIFKEQARRKDDRIEYVAPILRGGSIRA